MKFRHKRTLKLTLLALVLMAAFNSLLFASNLLSNRTLSLRLITRSMDVFQKAFSLNNSNKTYDEIAGDIARQKLKAGAGRSLYFLKPKYKPPTQISAPDYFRTTKNKAPEKPTTQVFDPRFTLSIYYEWMRLHPGKPVPFHWSDWLDMGVLNDRIYLPEKLDNPCDHHFLIPLKRQRKKILPVDTYCMHSAESPLGYQITKFPGAHSKQNAIVLAKSYLYTGFASPSRLVFMTNSKGAYIAEVEKQENDFQRSLLYNGMPEDVVGSQKLLKLDVLKSYKSLLKSKTPQIGAKAEPDMIHLDEAWFEMDINKTIQDLHKPNLGSHESRYLESLQYSWANKSPEKSLYEAEILPPDRLHSLGRHYDWRFFDGYSRGTDTQLAALHRLVRTYLKFCQTNGLVTWIAHGSLLSWYWNGLAFPWDLDADVQMPIRDLHRLARDFNQTLVLENAGHDTAEKSTDMEFNGMGAYFIDVGSSITHRNVENGLNRIDARFIDIHTGLYVDITGLAVTDAVPSPFYDLPFTPNMNTTERQRINKAKKLYNCRNTMWASHKELSPLTKTLIDNEIGYVPHDFESLLGQEYQPTSMQVPRVTGYEFIKNLRLWVKRHVMLDYLKNPTKWVNAKSGLKQQEVITAEVKTVGILPEEDAVNLLHEENILQEYVRSLRFTQFHETQRGHLVGDHQEEYFSEMEKYTKSGVRGRALWEDSFMRLLALNEWNRDEEIKKVELLQKTYQLKMSETDKSQK